MIGQLDHGEILDLTAGESARIRTAAGRFAEEPGDCAADLAERAAALVTTFPTELVRALHRYGNRSSAHNTLLVRGLLPDVADLPPTPGTTTPSALGPVGDCLIGLGLARLRDYAGLS